MKKQPENWIHGISMENEMKKIVEEITKEAKLVVEDYVKNPSEMSGSVVQIHETSPILNKDDN